MTRREEIQKIKQDNINKMAALKAENIELSKEDILICDKNQWFEEKEEEVKTRVNGKLTKVKQFIGRMYWIEEFKDESESEPQSIFVTRNKVVRVNGNWDF